MYMGCTWDVYGMYVYVLVRVNEWEVERAGFIGEYVVK